MSESFNQLHLHVSPQEVLDMLKSLDCTSNDDETTQIPADIIECVHGVEKAMPSMIICKNKVGDGDDDNELYSANDVCAMSQPSFQDNISTLTLLSASEIIDGNAVVCSVVHRHHHQMTEAEVYRSDKAQATVVDFGKYFYINKIRENVKIGAINQSNSSKNSVQVNQIALDCGYFVQPRRGNVCIL